ncbi:hypothetical protein CEXT_477471 [Caerostris extrusa]|uniref:Uncharacterized protein n=1 Tax=Caerostris extrusa TaxID=172846 RepID=A0AAV4X8F0_CAEEX|nr:hypothetical protein CEXT_477471 [Caerostris extrusa]
MEDKKISSFIFRTVCVSVSRTSLQRGLLTESEGNLKPFFQHRSFSLELVKKKLIPWNHTLRVKWMTQHESKAGVHAHMKKNPQNLKLLKRLSGRSGFEFGQSFTSADTGTREKNVWNFKNIYKENPVRD